MVPAKHSVLRGLIEWVLIISVALIAAFLIRSFVVEPYVVPTGSMEPTIQINDCLLGQKVTLELGQDVKAGDIVIFNNPDTTDEHTVLVKRVIATAGQTVDFQDGVVYVDGVALSEDYTQGITEELPFQADGVELSFPYTVPEDCIWVMGDNRQNSSDSRYFGAVPTDNLIAVAMLRYWPIDRFGTL